jgi:hypothetical protein
MSISVNGGGNTVIGNLNVLGTGDSQVAGQLSVGAGSTNLVALTVKPKANFTATGTTTANASTTITGTSTLFTTEIGVGDQIALSSASSTYATVTAIASATSLTVSTALGNGTSQTITVKKAIVRADTTSGAGSGSMAVADDGVVLVGYPSAHDAGLTTRIASPLQVRSGTGNSFFGRYSANTTGPTLALAKSRSGTVGTASVITTGDNLGNVAFRGVGSDGAAYTSGAQIVANSEGTIGSAIIPGFLALQTANSSGTLTTGLSINSAQVVTLPGTLILSTSSTPASAGAAGVAGTITWDASYIYVCTATNTWKRVAIATW